MSDPDFQEQPDEDNGLMAEATAWFARMRGPEAEMHRPAFEAWLARGALHRAFYNRAGEIYAMGKFLKEEQDGKPTSSWFRRHPALAPLTAGAIALTGLSVVWYYGPWHGVPRTAVAERSIRLTTEQGQVLTQALSDGSKVTLQPQSVLIVHYTSERRTLRLEQGRSRFEVAHERRPFVVLAGGGSVTARGTIFEVALNHRKHVTVRLLQGKVDVAIPSTREKPAVRHMESGETISFGETATQQTVPAPAPNDDGKPTVQTASSNPREFNATPLSEVLAIANRHGTAVRLIDNELADLKVTGRLRLDDPEKLAAKLALLFDLSIDHGGNGVILLRRRNK